MPCGLIAPAVTLSPTHRLPLSLLVCATRVANPGRAVGLRRAVRVHIIWTSVWPPILAQVLTTRTILLPPMSIVRCASAFVPSCITTEMVYMRHMMNLVRRSRPVVGTLMMTHLTRQVAPRITDPHHRPYSLDACSLVPSSHRLKQTLAPREHLNRTKVFSIDFISAFLSLNQEAVSCARPQTPTTLLRRCCAPSTVAPRMKSYLVPGPCAPLIRTPYRRVVPTGLGAPLTRPRTWH